jgi:hypothetical protein
MRRFVSRACGIVAALLALGFVVEAHAAGIRGIFPQRRGRTYRMPVQPAFIDSSPTIDNLNKALKALGETDRDYDGHREKAISHIANAIHNLETPTAKGKSNAAIEKAAIGKSAVATKTASTPQAASDESLRKAKTILFSVHHKLADHTSTKGQLHADSEVRRAITEIVTALTPPKTTSAAKASTAPASGSAIPTPKASSATPAK